MEESKESKTSEAKRPVKAPPSSAPPKRAPMAPPKTAPSDGSIKPKKKMVPPPSQPPPQSSNSAAGAFRAKAGALPPPKDPPPSNAMQSSVAKVRSAAKTNNSGAKPVGPPPARPPSAKGIPKDTSDNKLVSSSADDFERNHTSSQQVPGKSEPKNLPVAKTKISRPPSRESTSHPKSTAPLVDLLGDSSPIIASESSMKTTNSIQPHSRPSTASTHLNARGSFDIRNDNTESKASYSVGMPRESDYSSADRHNEPTYRPSSSAFGTTSWKAPSFGAPRETKRGISSYLEDEDTSSSIGFRSTAGRAAPVSGTFRATKAEDEVFVVKKVEAKDITGNGKKEEPLSSGLHQVTVNERADWKASSMASDYSLDGVEEICCLPNGNIEVMPVKDGTDAKRTPSSERVDDEMPELPFFESKSNKRLDEEEKQESKAESIREERNSEGRDTSWKYEYRHDEGKTDDEENVETRSHSSRSGRGKHSDEEDSREQNRSTTDRKDKRRSKRNRKHHRDSKKITAHFFNPKNMPYVPEDLLDFVQRPIDGGRGCILKCFIERNDTGSNKIAPIYTMLLEVNSSSGRPIMYARKKPSSRITSYYIISLNKEDLFLTRSMRSHQFLGKLRSSVSMMEYTLYGQGSNPEDVDSDCEVDDELRDSLRPELAFIRYHNNRKQYPRKMEVLLPAVVDNGTASLNWRPLTRDQMLQEHQHKIASTGGQNVTHHNNFIFMHKRESKYDPLSSCIVDFRSRATCVSVKNFQLVHSEPMEEAMIDKYRSLHPEFVYEDQGTVSIPQEHVILQLGKVGKDCFNVDFQYPLSMLQAFAISLSRFDTKQR